MSDKPLVFTAKPEPKRHLPWIPIAIIVAFVAVVFAALQYRWTTKLEEKSVAQSPPNEAPKDTPLDTQTFNQLRSALINSNGLEHFTLARTAIKNAATESKITSETATEIFIAICDQGGDRTTIEQKYEALTYACEAQSVNYFGPTYGRSYIELRKRLFPVLPGNEISEHVFRLMRIKPSGLDRNDILYINRGLASADFGTGDTKVIDRIIENKKLGHDSQKLLDDLEATPPGQKVYIKK